MPSATDAQPGPKKKKNLGLALTASSKSYRTPKPEQTNSVENGFITSGQRIPTNHNQTSAKSAKPLKQATHYPTLSKHGSAQYATRLCPNLKSDLNTTASANTLLTTIQKKHSEASTANKRELSFPPGTVRTKHLEPNSRNVSTTLQSRQQSNTATCLPLHQMTPWDPNTCPTKLSSTRNSLLAS